MIHPLSDVQSINIGTGTKIWQFVVVLPRAVIGENCNINSHCFVENDVVIGNNVTLKSGVQIWDGIQIEDNVFVGPNVTFVNNLYPRSQHYPEQHKGAIIREGASIGANSTLNGEIEIGRGAMIGAHSLVNRNIDPFTLWYGSPAKQMGYVSKDGIVLNENLFDSKSGEKYAFNTNGELEKL
jgi:UDP-2-acetamido-3-amino-2,3-dideoxy-glucuronate N-acetyltransferase